MGKKPMRRQAETVNALHETKPSRVVVVDDSRTIRRWLTSVVATDPRLELVGTAGSADEARAVIKATNPDVLTLDIEMPGMNGLEFLGHIMRLRPMPVIVFSGVFDRQPNAAKHAMAVGATICLNKPAIPTHDENAHLRDCIYAAATGRALPHVVDRSTKPNFADQILLVGASTGGVGAIEVLVNQLPEDAPPIVIAQHMPHSFLKSFSKRLNRLVSHDIGLASDGMRLAPGEIRIAPSSDAQTCVTWHSGAWHINFTAKRVDHTFCPSVDVLFASAVPWAQQVGALLLTGLGTDGAKGMLALRRDGATTLGQSRDSCAVYGMPGAALAMNASEAEFPIEEIGTEMLARLKAKEHEVYPL
ncbi:chemotaxis protein CheB [uncultured Tateyamaria sp.]|uniref:chemotaxis protein CheB n=1 Tax=uncultured Tateyamaria sp. TaxID=455651 RepID=UPI00260FA22E|nr:chemotaxis protein CheB [uncultured Tateyamaria sp.]